MSFEDEISALIDRPCRRDGCGRALPEWCPSDDFCSEVCETTWRAENNGCTVVDYDEFGIDVQVPADHPATPSYSPPQAGAFDDEPPRSFLHYMHRQVSRLWDRLMLGDVENFEPRGILSATERLASPSPSPAYGLMQVMHSGRTGLPVPPSEGLTDFLDQYGVTPRAWSQPGAFQAPAVPPSTVEIQRMREQIARIFGVPPALLEPPPPEPARTTWIPPGEPQVLNELGTLPMNLTASTPGLPYGYFRAPGMPPDQAYHVLPPREGEERRAELVQVSIDLATPDAAPLFYVVESRYDHLTDRVVFELRVRVPPQPPWINVQFNADGFVSSLATVAERVDRLHGAWTEERLEGVGLEQLGAEVEEPPEIPPYRDQPET